MVQMLAVDGIAIVLAVTVLVRRRMERARHLRRVREILGRPAARRSWPWRRRRIRVVVSHGAPIPRQLVDARSDLRTRQQRLADQEQFDTVGLPWGAAA